LADRVLRKMACLLMRWLFGLAVVVFRGDRAKDAELLVLRQENAVLRRNARRARARAEHPPRPLRARHRRPDRHWLRVAFDQLATAA
jgi:hypothetical protein